MIIRDYSEQRNPGLLRSKGPQRRPQCRKIKSVFRCVAMTLVLLLLTSGCSLFADSESISDDDSTYEPELTYEPQRPLPDSITTFAPFEDTLQPDNSLPDRFDSYSPTQSETRLSQG